MFIDYGETEKEYLKRADSLLAKVIDEHGHIYREVEPDLFKAVVRHIIGQQISTAAQQTIFQRLVDKITDINKNSINALSLEELQSIGISFRKANYIKNFASKVANGSFDIKALEQMDDKEVIKELTTLDGIGIWTAEMLLIFSLRRKDVISYGDLAIRRGLMKLYNLNDLDKNTFNSYRELYSPYGSIASLYIWAVSKV